jgi:hypothetical protein
MRYALALVVGLAVACGASDADTRLAAGGAFRTLSPATTPSPTTPLARTAATQRPTAALTPCGTDAAAGLAGKWRPSNVTLLADRTTVTTPSISSVSGLCLEADSTWRYGTATGTYSTAPIQIADWARWSMPASAGQKRKLVLAGWPGGTADGPIEENGDPSVVWVISRVAPPDYPFAGTLSISFAR